MPGIGVDEWVARSGDRREEGSGARRALTQIGTRVGWWPRLAIVTVVGLLFVLSGPNGNIENVAFDCMLYAMLALGLNIAVGWAGLLDLGYIAFFGFGAYGYALFSSSAFGSGGSGGAHFPAIETILIVVAASGFVGLAIGSVAMRLSGDYLAIVTLFVGQAFVEIVNNVDPGTLGGVNGLYDLDPLHGFGGQINSTTGYLIVAIVMTALLAAILHLLDTSRTGRAWRAIRDDPLAAEAMTIPVNWLKLMAFSFGAMVGALAGTLFAAQNASVFPTNFTANILILIYACLVLGGVGSIAGAIVGGIVVTAALNLLSSPADAAYLFYGLILLTLLIKIRPWLHLVLLLVGTVAFGLIMHAIVGAISPSAVAGHPGSTGWIGAAVSHWVIVPADATTYGNILYIVLLCALIALVRIHGIWRLIALVPTLYVAACCWESRLVVNPAITTQILVGVVLIVVMAARPSGLLGTKTVEIV